MKFILAFCLLWVLVACGGGGGSGSSGLPDSGEISFPPAEEPDDHFYDPDEEPTDIQGMENEAAEESGTTLTQSNPGNTPAETPQSPQPRQNTPQNPDPGTPEPDQTQQPDTPPDPNPPPPPPPPPMCPAGQVGTPPNCEVPPPPPKTFKGSLYFDDRYDRASNGQIIPWGMWAQVDGVDQFNAGIDKSDKTQLIWDAAPGISATGSRPVIQADHYNYASWNGNIIGMTTGVGGNGPERFEALIDLQFRKNNRIYMQANHFFWGKPQGGPFQNDHTMEWDVMVNSDGTFGSWSAAPTGTEVQGTFYGTDHDTVVGRIQNDTDQKVRNAVFAGRRFK